VSYFAELIVHKWKSPPVTWVCLGLAAVTFALYSPSLSHEFLAYDDQQYVTENARVQAGLKWSGVAWAFGTFYASNWHPMTWLSHMLDCQLYGLRPAGHHLTNILLHTVNSVLLLLLLRRLTGALWRSAAVAALFAWHPLHVESVAWIAERKDLLGTCFFLLTLWAYDRYARAREGRLGQARWFYALALFLFALGLMSKPMLVTLPFVLLLLDFWPLGRTATDLSSGLKGVTWPRLILEKVPFFALSTACCLLTIHAQQGSYSVVSTAGLPLVRRLSHVLVAYVHYLLVMLVPYNLAVHYPYPEGTPTWAMLSAGALLALITFAVFRFARSLPWLLVGWLWYLGTLVPVIGLVQVGDQAWADRYTYIPLIGLFIAAVWGIERLSASWLARNVRAPVVGVVAVGVGLGLLAATWHQLGYWKTTQTLFEHDARVTKNNSRALTVLGSLLAREGRLPEALDMYTEALRYQSDDPETHFFLGKAREEQGQLDEAIAEYTKALWFKPLREKTHLALGVALARKKNYEGAATQYRAVLELNPESANAENNLARVLHSQGRFDEAIEHYSKALKLAPNLAQAHNNLGVLLVQQGRLTEGVTQLSEAVKLRPDDAEAQYNLAMALNQQKRWQQAAEILSKLEPSLPKDARLHCELGQALAHMGKTRDAMSHFAQALLLQPDFADALDRLSWILATDPRPEIRNSAEAVDMAGKACELTRRKDPEKLKTLAAAYAETGRFPEAITTLQNALAVGGGSHQEVNEWGLMMENFKAGKPWREKGTGP
jgi:tetratricopeptide (TPR) repeat protein